MSFLLLPSHEIAREKFCQVFNGLMEAVAAESLTSREDQHDVVSQVMVEALPVIDALIARLEEIVRRHHQDVYWENRRRISMEAETLEVVAYRSNIMSGGTAVRLSVEDSLIAEEEAHRLEEEARRLRHC